MGLPKAQALQWVVRFFEGLNLRMINIRKIRGIYVPRKHQLYGKYTIFRVGDNLNIKVADFGLARDVHIKEYYRQCSSIKIPIKWMAPESLHDRISNEKTDVVSLYI